MADNTVLSSGSGGDTIVTREISHGGDTSKLPGSFLMGISGSEGSYTAAAIGGDATNGLQVDVTRVSGTVTVAGAVTQSGTWNVGTVTTVTTVAAVTSITNTVTVAGTGTFAVQVDGAALTALQLLDDAVYTGGTGTPSKGIAVMGTDGTNPQLVSVNTSGHVNIADGGNTITVDGTVAATQSGTWTVQPGNTANTTAWLVTGTGGSFPVTDSGGSLTIDNATLSVTGGGVEASALRVTIASDSTGVLSVDDNGSTISVDDGGGSLTVDVGTALPAGTNNIGDVDIASIAAGDNNIGNVDVVTVPADPFGANADAAATAGSTGSIQAKLRLMTSQLDAIKTAVETLDNAISGSEIQADVVTQPVRARTTDHVGAALCTDAIMQGTTARTPAYAIIDAATSGDNTLLAAQGAGNKIRVLSLFLVASAAVTVRFESGAGGTALTGQMSLAANGGFVLPFNPAGWFETAANTLLNLELSGATSVDGSFQYIVVT